MPPKKQLASKEATLFKELLGLYENRQLKKGIKTADAILKKNPEHGGPLLLQLSFTITLTLYFLLFFVH